MPGGIINEIDYEAAELQGRLDTEFDRILDAQSALGQKALGFIERKGLTGEFVEEMLKHGHP